MSVKINDNYNHVFRHSKYHKEIFQSNYIVFDVETKERKISNTQKELTFKLISYFFIENFEVIQKGVTDNLNQFWFKFHEFVKDKEKVICINNNMGFDIRASKAFYYLEMLNYQVSEKFYMKNRTLILPFIKKIKKEKREILFLDMQNYFPYLSVKQFGKVINLEKLEIDFDKCSMKELQIYALRDVEIVWYFFKYYINFLRENQLVSNLKPTQSSLALSIYRTKFHKNKKIFIHNCITATKLEKESYRGGISDVFLKDVEVSCYYVDINSFYAFIMKNVRLPARLIANFFEISHGSIKLLKYLQKCLKSNKYCCIANVSYSLHEGYLLNNKEGIICNVHGNNLKGSFCQPELEYILSHGNILKIHQITIYETELLFDKYVDFFYNIKKNSSGVIREFSKKFLTNLYGKWGQLKEEIKVLTKKQLQNYYDVIKNNEEIIMNESIFSHIATILGEGDIYKIGKKLYLQKRKKTKAFDAFIAISSYVTSACRVYLMKLKEIAEGSNVKIHSNNEIDVYYCDTDSLFISNKGFMRLKNSGYIGKELGQLKLEVEGLKKGIFHAPKDYKFDELVKCKGIKKKSIKISDNTFKVEEFESLNKAIKKGNLDKIIITEKIKTMKRLYKKGNVLENGIITPYVI